MKKMNRNLLTALVLTGALSLLPVSRAADNDANAKSPSGERRERIRDRLQEVAKELNLTEDQKEKLKPILHAEMEKIKELRENKDLTREQKIEKFKAIREEAAPQVKAILTPEQLEKWQKMREEFREKVAQRRHQK